MIFAGRMKEIPTVMHFITVISVLYLFTI